MASNLNFSLSGNEKIDRFLRTFPEAFRKEALEMAAKKPALLIREEARTIVSKTIVRKSSGHSGQSKAAFVARNIKSVKSRSKTNPGYNIYLKGKDIDVGDKKWNIQGYGVLLGEGSKGKRKTKKGANRGKSTGSGNFIASAGRKQGARSSAMMLRNIQLISNSYMRTKL